MAFPIKKRINTDLFIDKMAAPYIVAGQIKDEHVAKVTNHWYWLICRSSLPFSESAKGKKDKG